MSSTRSSNSRNRFGDEAFGNSHGVQNYPDFCACGLKVYVQTSWTEFNPGRRFVTCPIRNGTQCKFFQWCDPPICDRGKRIIPGLLRKIAGLQTDLNVKHSKEKKKTLFSIYYAIVIVSFLCVAVMTISPLYGSIAIVGVVSVMGMILRLLQ